MSRRVAEGSPEPLGLMLDAEGANVAVFSAHAERIELCLFDDSGERETERVNLRFRTGDVFHAHIAGIREGARYGLRAHGPFEPSRGHRFDAAKLLVDPYALALDRAFAAHHSFHEAARGVDTAPFAPKAVATSLPHVDPASRPRRPWRDTVIYELHVRGFSKLNPAVPERLRGTFAGLAHEASVAHLKRLGVTAVEIMPCAAWIDERHLAALGLSNYWGYNPVAMMAPDPRLAPGGWRELREAVETLHGAGIEVILDVVFNHSGEGDEFGPTLCLRGLDNATYYRLAPDDPSRYVNDAGCGNILAFDRAIVVRYALDALRAFARYGGVDGFRFDLATVLARRREGFDPEAPFLAALRQDPELRELKLIAEPWDVGPGGYRLGGFSPLGEWNDRFRDTARRFWRGDPVGVSDLATRIGGSSDIFARHGRPSRSVNFITAHDGFTLADLVAHERKHNEANGEDNRDGTNENHSWNNGVEGASDDPRICAARLRDQRNLLATLLLSRGTPMLSMGAEMGATQYGDNNAYAQDNEIGWLDWAARDRALLDFAARVVALRGERPALRADRFLSGAAVDDTLIRDVEWLRADGSALGDANWRDAAARTLVVCFYVPPTQSRPADRVIVVLHRGGERAKIKLPPPRDGHCWRRLLDTGDADASGFAEDETFVHERSVVLFGEEATARARRETAISSQLLSRLAEGAGVALQWRDVDGGEHSVPQATIEALLEQLGLPAGAERQGRDSLARLAETQDCRAIPASCVLREGEETALRLCLPKAPAMVHVALESGEELRLALGAGEVAPLTWTSVDGRAREGYSARLPRLPRGRHIVTLESGEACRMTVAPRECRQPRTQGRVFGLSAQLYSLRRDGDQGVGDFTTLAQLAALAAGEGAAMLALNPMHALFAWDRERASPYYPSDRRFLDPLYLDLRSLGDFLPELTTPEDAAEAAALHAAKSVDYPRAHLLKQRVLERAFARFCELPPQAPPVRDFELFVRGAGAALVDFACFETIGGLHGGDWRRWPHGLRDRAPAALSTFAAERARELRFQQFQQWLCEKQFERAAKHAPPLGFCRDLAVGAAPDGAESWSNAGQLLKGFSVGAPPDAFSREGQIWGLPPQNPLQWRADGGASFAELLRANMRHAGALRIDHVMALSRLFVAPDGAKASEGAYLSYPLDALLGQLALESDRAGCFVVGEDLGTLPWGFRERLDAAGVLSYRVLWFEREGGGFAPPSHYPPRAMACVSTHDLPTLAGWWAGADIAEKAALGLIGAEAAADEIARRRYDRRALLDALRREGLIGDRDEGGGFDDALAAALHAYVARTPSLLTIAQIDDLAGESRAVNLPGTDRERENWRRKLAPSLPLLFEGTRGRAILDALRRNLVQIPAA